ncbi:TPA: NAD(P)-dependent oxidoreductase [Candidatus Poribacteria bacterium]|nr:NAD(P)-dependent oxidoreductase [Candidatus Poribacteria bacterium]HIO09055.1 NAD(P)-dependent oxidoreductase [Candidatus Poribacteria bacterium]HIO80255.1 NAD(P)-dependent oxidoreductase [Candidatus Poribacteria bacterium]
MSTILVTGASGFIGKSLNRKLAENHQVICLSRKDPGLELPWVKGAFASFEDLTQIDSYQIDILVHLGAVTGGMTERDCVLVNVEGTRCLMRYLINRGCKKYVLASSIAAVGFQDREFRPLQLPVPDEHPCLDRSGYGLSKYLMEEISKYCHRQNEEIDVINLRLSSVCADDRMPPLKEVGSLPEWSLGGITIMNLTDAVRAFVMSAEASYHPGVRIMNAAGPKAWTSVPVVEILRNWWGDDVDLSHFEQPGHEYNSVYEVSRIKREIGFIASHLPGKVSL